MPKKKLDALDTSSTSQTTLDSFLKKTRPNNEPASQKGASSQSPRPGSKKTRPNNEPASQKGASSQSPHPGSKKTNPNGKTATQQGASNQPPHELPGPKKTRPNNEPASQKGASSQSPHPGSKKTNPNGKTATQQGASNQPPHELPGPKKTRPNNEPASQKGASSRSPHPGSKKTNPNGKTATQQGASNQPPHELPGPKEEADHGTHTIKYRFRFKKRSITGKAGTVEQLLQQVTFFTQNREKNKDKEMVIIREDRRAVCSHFPCSAIGDGELLTIKYIEALKEPKCSIRVTSPPQGRKQVIFHVNTKGGKSITKQVVKNKALKTIAAAVSVYAYEGDTVKQALKRDGRFNKTLFTKECVLSEPITDPVETELTNLVDDLNGKSFNIVLTGRSIQTDSQPSSLEDYLPTESQGSPPQQSATNGPLKPLVPEQRGILNSSNPKAPLRDIPDSGDILKLLRSQFHDLVKHMKEREKVSKLSQVKRIFTEEFGKNVQTCLEVKRVKELILHGESVCQVRINGSPVGSGFLLFGRFVLTNGHVVTNIYDKKSGELREAVTVTFCFEDHLDKGDQCKPVRKEVVAFAHFDSGSLLDFALLELCNDPGLTGLLGTFGFPPLRGGICIIGHPEGGVKKIDPCFIVPFADRRDTAKEHLEENKDCMHLITAASLKNNWDHDLIISDRQRLTYNSCFYHGSSGSPVFDEHCKLIAMHSGGYAYENRQKQKQSVIEYAFPMSLVLEKVLIQVRRKRIDVWQEFPKHANPECQNIIKKVLMWC